MDFYPSKFPSQARARVEADKILAYRNLDKQGKKVSSGVAIEALVRDCILRIFLVFAEELCAFGQENGWTVDQIDSDANEFLRRLTIEVQYRKGRGYVSIISHLNGSLTQDTERQFRQSPKWKRYENLLLGVAKIQQMKPKPDVSLGRKGRYYLPESSPKAWEDLKNDLEGDGAKNLKVYAGTWQHLKLGTRIDREEGSKALHGPAAPSELLAWLEVGKVQGPLVIEAELPPLVSQSETQEPRNYQEEIERVRAIRNDTEGVLMYGPAWPHVRELAAIEKKLPYTDKPVELEAQRKELRKILWENYPQAAEKLGLPGRLEASRTDGKQTESSRAQNSAPSAKSVESESRNAAPKSWQEIEIAFLSDERVEICCGATQRTYNYGELHFEDRRNGTPNRAWTMLRGMAKNGGTTPRPPAGKERAAAQKRIEEIRQRLRRRFKIDTDPIPFNGSVYQTSFKIGCRPCSDT